MAISAYLSLTGKFKASPTKNLASLIFLFEKSTAVGSGSTPIIFMLFSIVSNSFSNHPKDEPMSTIVLPSNLSFYLIKTG